MFGSALLRKQFALMRLEHAFQHLSALRRFRIGHPHSGNFEAPLRIPLGVAFADAQG